MAMWQPDRNFLMLSLRRSRYRLLQPYIEWIGCNRGFIYFLIKSEHVGWFRRILWCRLVRSVAQRCAGAAWHGGSLSMPVDRVVLITFIKGNCPAQSVWSVSLPPLDISTQYHYFASYVATLAWIALHALI